MFTNKKVHMIGIGGISMSGIAEILLSFGCKVTGYDRMESDITNNLIAKGIEVFYETNISNVQNADIIVYTAAIKEDNEELKYARKQQKEVYERSTFLGLLMKDYENVLCISGTHGKSSTSGMVSQIFMSASLNPTIQIGAMLPIIGGNNHVGEKKYFIAEACEYVDSFLKFYPTSIIITNIDNDHLDYFKNIDNIIKSFNKYVHLLGDNGHLIINSDDDNTLKATSDITNKITYGINRPAKYMAKNITYDDLGHGIYDLYIDNNYKCQITLGVTGIHNIYNSLAAIAMSQNYIQDINIIKEALSNYHGVGRRFEHLGKFKGANVFDDYAHHPSEIATTLESINKTKKRKAYAIFQPHTYSRTHDHFNHFIEVLSKFENIIITKTYAARETDNLGISEEDIVKKINECGNNNAIYLETFEEIENYLAKMVSEDDLIITIGAGDIYKVAHNLISKNSIK